MQMMQPSKSASVFPMASNEDKILGSCREQFRRCYIGGNKRAEMVSITADSKLNRNTEFIHHERNMIQTTILDLDVLHPS